MLPLEVHKTYEDQPPPAKGRIRINEPRIYSLFGFALSKVGLMGYAPNRTIDTETIVDGVIARYDAGGQLTLFRYYPSSAIVWPGPMIADTDGVTVVMHVEGPVPDPLRLHPDIPDGWAGMTLLVHYDERGREAWVAPLGKGERVVHQLVRTADGYLTIALAEQGRCELSRWQLEQ
jgi:hypothetical protein